MLGASFFVDSAKAGKVLEGVAADTFGALVRDAMGSHVVEVIVQVGKLMWYGGRCNPDKPETDMLGCSNSYTNRSNDCKTSFLSWFLFIDPTAIPLGWGDLPLP